MVLVNKGKWGNILQPLGGDSPIKIEKKKMNKKKKVFLPTDPKKFGDVTGNKHIFFLALQVNKALDNMEYLLIIKDTFVYFSLEPMLLVPIGIVSSY